MRVVGDYLSQPCRTLAQARADIAAARLARADCEARQPNAHQPHPLELPPYDYYSGVYPNV